MKQIHNPKTAADRKYKVLLRFILQEDEILV